MKDIRTDVVIVGAGPAGLMLTEVLARAGRRITIVERQPDPTRVAQSVMLQPSVLGILDRLQISSRTESGGGQIAGLEEYGPHGRLFSGRYAGLPDSPSGYGQIISQGELRRLLLHQVARFPNVTILTSTSVARLPRHDVGDCLVETVDAGSGGKEFRIASDWVVAADGKLSTTRELAGIKAKLLGFDHTMFLTPVPTPRGYPPLIRMHRQPTTLVVTVPEAAPGITYLFTHVLNNGVAPAALLDDCARTVREHDPTLAEAVRHSAITEKTIAIEPQTVVAESWRRGGVILLGDSAHAMHSFGAQGLNISIQNAALLGCAINQHASRGDVSVVDSVERRRRPFIEALQRAQRDLDNQLWPTHQVAEPSWFAGRFDELALGQPEFRSRWLSGFEDVRVDNHK